ncbi:MULTISPECIES: hypothetical protein [unclassified Chryseobacterium]|uniref:hypothetical protein n=1 Tax=unclassified Chryseobacterium TaxID=2593645 RepID=UPI0028537376|nr:hypothetical protein [Chryseobacterium sp. CFS7]MDR4892285.1 hypothetical protein [Chryseobacterium sp. CFS7]
METNELRLGNYVMDKKDENLECVYLLQDLGDLVYINDLHPDNCMPIPLTEEWLLTFGFTLMPESEYTLNTYEKEEFQLWNKKGDFSEIVYLSSRDTIELKSVHQLQNLFFALKGKELTLKIN